MRKKALLVGINDYQDAPLRGCVNDVTNMKQLLLDTFGFKPENLKIILNHQATGQVITQGLAWLADDLEQDSVRIFHFAGHGHFVPDDSGDEPDGSDEALVPVDYVENGFIIDDKLKTLYDKFPDDCNLTLIMDCCHSGTNQRAADRDVLYRFLPVTYKERKAIAAAKRKFLQDQREYVLEHTRQLRGREVPLEKFQEKVLAVMQQFEKQRFGDHRLRTNNVLLAACQSDQKAADAKFERSYEGAFTHYLTQIVRDHGGDIDYQQLLETVGEELDANEFTQIPQLECSEGRESARIFG